MIFQNKFFNKELIDIVQLFDTCELGFGKNVSLLESRFESFSNKKYNVATNSASAAAFVLFSYLKEAYGECDVYVPSLTFSSPVWAAQHHGHNIIFVDVQDDANFSFQDYLSVRRGNGSLCKPVVMPTLYSGVSTIQNIDLVGDEILVVDSAHCIAPTIKCDFTFFSFHPQKPICSSDGGMLSCDNESAYHYFNSYRNFGRQNLSSGYDINQNGFKFYMNNLNATIALSQLNKQASKIQERKARYEKLKIDFGEQLSVHDDKSSYYFATLISEKSKEINEINKLQKLYPPLHNTSFYKKFKTRDLPNTERIYENLCNIPLSHSL